MAGIRVRQAPEDDPEDTGIRKHRWTRDEVYRAMAAGVFDGTPTDWLKMELIEGELIEKMPQNRSHSVALAKGQRILGRIFADSYYIAVQTPLHVNSANDPEPDLMVVRGDPDAYLDHPTGGDVVLVMEISDTTLRQDRMVKPAIYAYAHVQEYWVLMLNSRALEVRRDAQRVPGTDDWAYQSVEVLKETATIMPLSAPNATILVADLLPGTARQPVAASKG